MDIVKPKSSRESSAEHFIICRYYDPPKNFCLNKLSTFEIFSQNMLDYDKLEHKDVSELPEDEIKKDNEKIYKYVTSGDLSAYDE